MNNTKIYNSSINNSPFTFAEKGSTVIIHTSEQKDEFEWEHLERDLMSALESLPANSNEALAARSILKRVQKRDMSEVKTMVNAFAQELVSKTFIAVASTFLCSFIQSILNK